MTSWQKAVKYSAIAFAICLCVSIFNGIFGAIGLVFNTLDGKDNAGKMKTYNISSNIQELKLDINAARLVIANSDTLRVESNNKYLKVTEQDGCLIINETERNYSDMNGKIEVTLYLPEDIVLKNANISTGAGQVKIDRLAAENLYLELGAGQVNIDTLEAYCTSQIIGGAGQMILSNGALQNLKLDMGVGELRFTSALKGDCEFDMGVGAAHITLIGSENDYRIELDKGLGDARINGQSLSDGAVCGNGANSIEVEGGIGEIRINFSEISA